MDVTKLALTWVGWLNGEKLASACVLINFDLGQSALKSKQVHARARICIAWPNGVQS